MSNGVDFSPNEINGYGLILSVSLIPEKKAQLHLYNVLCRTRKVTEAVVYC